MSESRVVLAAIHDDLSCDAFPETCDLILEDDRLTIRSGAAAIGVEVRNDEGAHPHLAHVHVIVESTLDAPHVGDGGGPVRFEACVAGIHRDRKRALQDAAKAWFVSAAPPILSSLVDHPVLGAELFEQGDAVGFQGPLSFRLLPDDYDLANDAWDRAELFAHAGALAPPEPWQLVKSTLEAGESGWRRRLEFSGHAVSHQDAPESLPAAPSHGVAHRFVALRLRNPLARRQIDEAIRLFVETVGETGTASAAENRLLAADYDADLVRQVAAYVPLAIGREVLTAIGVRVASMYVVALHTGEPLEGQLLLDEPVFARTAMLARREQRFAWQTPEWFAALKQVAVLGPEVGAVQQAIESGARPDALRLSPPIIPGPGADRAACERVARRFHGEE